MQDRETSARLVQEGFAAVRTFVDARTDGSTEAKATVHSVPGMTLPTPHQLLFAIAAHAGADSWVSDLSGGLGTLMLGQAPAGNRSMQRFAENEDFGPIAMTVASAAFGYLGAEPLSGHFARLARVRWSFDGAFRDLSAVLDSIGPIREMPAAIGARWRRSPALDELFADLPDDGNADLQAWRGGLLHVWGHGLEDFLRDQLPR